MLGSKTIGKALKSGDGGLEAGIRAGSRLRGKTGKLLESIGGIRGNEEKLLAQTQKMVEKDISVFDPRGQILRKRGRHRVMAAGAGAAVLNMHRTGDSTGGSGQLSPRTPGGFA